MYVNNMLITGSSEQEHLDNLARVLQRLEAAGMRLTKKKCGFLIPVVAYLGLMSK
jgi:hypothetical protein